jgi:hypothetical protein
MALRPTLHVTRVGVIEAISIAAGVATLFSVAQNIVQNNPRITQSKIGHLVGFKDQRRADRDSEAKTLAYNSAAEANISDQQFSALLYQEASLLNDLPPLLEQLHADIGALEQLRKEARNIQTKPLIKAASRVVVHDKAAIVHLMIKDHVQLNEIIWPRQHARLPQLVPSGS